MDGMTKLERGPMVGRMLEGDFEKDTITFHMPATYYLANGRYIIEPESDWLRRKEQLEALSARASAGEGVYCAACKGSGEVEGYVEHPSGDPQDAYVAAVTCPQCDGTGDAHKPTESVVFQGTTAQLQSAYFGDWSAARAWAGKNGHVTMHTVRKRQELTAAPQPAQAGASGGGEVVAWLHDVVADDGEADQALSFSPDSFPLQGVCGYRSTRARPLFTAAPSEILLAYENLLADHARLKATSVSPATGGRDSRNEAFNLADTVIERIECGDKQGARDAIREEFERITTRPTPEAEARDGR